MKIKIKDKNLCPRYCCRLIRNVKIGPSRELIQKRLTFCGIRPINNIVDITNYIMLEIGQPMHAFDADKVKDGIIVRPIKKKEKLKTLDGQTRELDKGILVIADFKKPIAIAGIIGGFATQVSGQTKNIILESANFDSTSIIKTSKKLGLETEASIRFSRGVDINLCQEAIERASNLIDGESAKGETSPKGGKDKVIDIYPQKTKLKKIKFTCQFPWQKKILRALGFKVRRKAVIVPSWRKDVNIPEDLQEEIWRIYGYENIPSQLPQSILVPSKSNELLIWQNKVKDILVSLGFTEVYNYSFSRQGRIKIKNPFNKNQSYLRSGLIPGLIKNVKDNLRYFKEVRIFEMGKVYPETWRLAGAGPNLVELRGVVETMFNKMGISDIWFDDYQIKIKDQRSKIKDISIKWTTEVKIGEEVIGLIGESNEIALFELDFEKMVKMAKEEKEYEPIAKYPSAKRDLAILVDIDTKISHILSIIQGAGVKIVQDVDLFDEYTGEEIPQGKKNLAFHIIYQADDHTLTDEEVDETHQKIIKALEEEAGAEMRK